MRVLIAGCGYVGLPLGAALVKDGHAVFGITRRARRKAELEQAGIQPLIADITRPEVLKQIRPEYDWVIDCVASAGGDAADYEKLYLNGTRNLLDWLKGSPPKTFIYTSSTSVYGQTNGSVVDENSPTEPEAQTAKILVQAEALLRGAATTHNFPVVIFRAAAIYGPGRGYAFKQFIDGKAALDATGSRWLNMIHRDDLIGIIRLALERGHSSEIYNAVDNEPVTQRQFFEWLAK